MRDNFKLISGVIAFGIYLLIVIVIVYYFNYRDKDRSTHYVNKTSQRLDVSLAGSQKAKSTKSKRRHQNIIRNITSPKPHKRVKHSKKVAKKIKAKSLFSSIKPQASKTQAKKRTKPHKSASQILADAQKNSNSGKGVKNAYFASIEQKLRGWPAQVNFAGETISVTLKVYRSGAFDYHINRLSANPDFNQALITYLKQLQSIGFGKHNNPKPYVINVEFEAKE